MVKDQGLSITQVGRRWRVLGVRILITGIVIDDGQSICHRIESLSG